jgi:predicted ester cyclase
MPFAENTAVIQHFVESFNSGNLDSIDKYIARDFFNYSPPAGEESVPEVLRPLAGDIWAAIPDLKLEVTDFALSYENLVTFSLTISGTHENQLWGAPGHGEHGAWTSTVTSRFEDGKFAFSWEELPIRELLGALRQIGMVPAPEDMDKPHKYPVSIPEFLLRLVFTGQVADKYCSHLGKIQVVEPTTDVCEQSHVSHLWLRRLLRHLKEQAYEATLPGNGPFHIPLYPPGGRLGVVLRR